MWQWCPFHVICVAFIDSAVMNEKIRIHRRDWPTSERNTPTLQICLGENRFVRELQPEGQHLGWQQAISFEDEIAAWGRVYQWLHRLRLLTARQVMLPRLWGNDDLVHKIMVTVRKAETSCITEVQSIRFLQTVLWNKSW